MSNRLDRGISHNPDFLPSPDLKLGSVPVWWHHHGIEMHPVTEGQEGYEPDKLVIKGSAAEVVIARCPEYTRDTYWDVDWKVINSQEEFAQGRVLFNSDSLKRAFGLSDEPDGFGRSILEKYGGTTASQGEYIRYNDFLNIPGPGTGHDGDPNVSIQLDEEIRGKVQQLMNEAR